MKAFIITDKEVSSVTLWTPELATQHLLESSEETSKERVVVGRVKELLGGQYTWLNCDDKYDHLVVFPAAQFTPTYRIYTTWTPNPLPGPVVVLRHALQSVKFTLDEVKAAIRGIQHTTFTAF